MSSRVGFHGGSSIFELGNPADVAFFFRCIECFVVQKSPAADWSIVSDRLYKRYLRQEELEVAIRLMKSVQEVFGSLPGIAPLNENSLIDEAGKTRLNWSLPTLSDVFCKYFEGLAYCVESANGFLTDWALYKPVRIVKTDLPDFAADKKRSLAEYDGLGPDESPFWMR